MMVDMVLLEAIGAMMDAKLEPIKTDLDILKEDVGILKQGAWKLEFEGAERKRW